MKSASESGYLHAVRTEDCVRERCGFRAQAGRRGIHYAQLCPTRLDTDLTLVPLSL